MITVFSLLMAVLVTLLMKNSNPVKMSINLMMTSLIVFFILALSSGKIWAPSIFIMLFLGGILMVFMIISSVLPNEKNKKFKKPNILMFFMLLTIYMMNWIMNDSSTMNYMKLFMSSKMNFLMFIIIMILYFFMFMTLMSKQKLSMRTVVNYCMK